ncbi:MAG: putative membrane protein YjdF [Paracoccaceae bacterium]|jgi:uncharacterized membrane protein YjdF
MTQTTAFDPARTLTTMLLAGATATVAFDLYGQAISPLMGFATLAPVPLARQTLQTVLGASSEAGGQLLHYLAGLVAYPVGWMIGRRIMARVAPGLPWIVGALAYGVLLWIFAIGFLASIINGNPFFLGWTGITWVALAGHVLFAVVAAVVIERREAAP